MDKKIFNLKQQVDRREFLNKTSMGLGALALSALTGGQLNAAKSNQNIIGEPTLPFPNIAAKAKRIVYLFMSGGPSQMDLFDYKPYLKTVHGQELPASIRQGQRLTGMSGSQTSFPMVSSEFAFKQHGQSGAWMSELLPHTAKLADELCIIKSMNTEAINHDPAITFFQSGNQIAGRPSIGAWMSYGLGSLNDNLPSFIVLVSKNAGGQPLYARLWGNAFLPTHHQGVQFRSGGDPVLYLNNPEGYSSHDREEMISYVKSLNEFQASNYNDPEINNRISQYEMAFRMQSSIPEVTDMSDEPDSVFEMYGEDSRDKGTYAANCIMARRLLEKDVRFVQLYHQGWDQHNYLASGLASQCKKTDQATAALLTDLKQRGLLEDTLVIWGGEFGRTVYSQGKLEKGFYGRDHHPRCFTMWMAGAGVKKGHTYGETDEFGYNVIKDPVHVHDFHATMMHLMGIEHEKLIFKHQGRRYRLTDVHGKVVEGLLA